MMRRGLLVIPVCVLALAMAAAQARAENPAAAPRCELKAFAAPQAAAPPGYFERARNRLIGWVYPREQPDAVLARRGGLRLVLRADGDAFRAVLLDDLRDIVRCLMREARIAHGELAVRDGGVDLQLREAADTPRALAAIAAAVPGGQPPGAVGLHDSGNGLIRLGPTPAAYETLLGQAVDRTVAIIRRRLNELGFDAAGVRRDGADRIVVTLPGEKDAAHLVQVVVARGRLQFRLVDTSVSPQDAVRTGAPAGTELVRGTKGDEQFLLRREVAMTGADIADARADFDQNNQPVVTFRFTARGARTFGRLTQENIGRPVAIVFDGKVLSAPVIREPILGGVGQISGNFTVQQASDLAVLLRAGTLPLDFVPIEQKTVEPATK